MVYLYSMVNMHASVFVVFTQVTAEQPCHVRENAHQNI